MSNNIGTQRISRRNALIASATGATAALMLTQQTVSAQSSKATDQVNAGHVPQARHIKAVAVSFDRETMTAVVDYQGGTKVNLVGFPDDWSMVSGDVIGFTPDEGVGFPFFAEAMTRRNSTDYHVIYNDRVGGTRLLERED